MITHYWSNPNATWVLFCGNAVTDCNQTIGFIFIHILFFHLVTWNPAIFLSSVWSIATCRQTLHQIPNHQGFKAPWKPPIHYQTHYEWNDLWPSKIQLGTCLFVWQISSLQKWPWKMPSCEVWEANKVKWHLFPPSPSTWSPTPKKTIQNVWTHAWFKDVGFGV